MLRDPGERLLHPGRQGLVEPAGIALPDRLVQVAKLAHETGLGRRRRQQRFHLRAVLGRQLAVEIGVQLGLADAALGHHFTLRSAGCPPLSPPS